MSGGAVREWRCSERVEVQCAWRCGESGGVVREWRCGERVEVRCEWRCSERVEVW